MSATMRGIICLMLFIDKKKRIVNLGIGTLVSLCLCGCSTIDNTINKQIEKNKAQTESKDAQANKVKTEESKNNSNVVNDEEFKMSDSQKKRLSEAESQTAEEALENSEKTKKSELALNVPQEKAQFTDVNEFSQYISYLLYQYHSGDIPGKEFYSKGKKYMSELFFDQLPKSDSERQRTFVELQKMFKEQLGSDIDSYKITTVEVDERAKEANFYRKYTLKNGERVYYQTTMKQEDGKWLLLDDSPSESYVVENTNKKFQK